MEQAHPGEKVQTCKAVALCHVNWAPAHIITIYCIMTHTLGNLNLEMKLSGKAAKAAKKRGTEARDMDLQRP